MGSILIFYYQNYD